MSFYVIQTPIGYNYTLVLALTNTWMVDPVCCAMCGAPSPYNTLPCKAVQSGIARIVLGSSHSDETLKTEVPCT